MTNSLCEVGRVGSDPFRQPDVNSGDPIFSPTCPCDNLPYFLVSNTNIEGDLLKPIISRVWKGICLQLWFTFYIFFKGIRSVVDRLIAGGVQHIIIGSIFYRSKHRGITSDEYNSKAEQLNRFLHHYFQDSKKVNFWQIRGFMQVKKNILVDGVHLNEDAMIKYAAQVRMAVKCDDFRVWNLFACD